MARTLTLAVARARMKVAAVPSVNAIPSPIMATTDIPRRREMLFTVERASSSSNALCSASKALLPCSEGTATQIECSEEACVIMSTLMLLSAMAAMKRWATPGTPISDAPSRLTSATLSMEVMPLIGMTGAPLVKTLSAPAPPFCCSIFLSSSSSCLRAMSVSLRVGDRPWITVPLKEGLKIFLTYTGMFPSIQGTMALG
mmetsp:Transcript_28341/g.91717  ORF Transcript_28341/g.91717 Transcript_28341/m.91717 type:complete len:200 (+) Transcript_28341:1214-1813(+)